LEKINVRQGVSNKCKAKESLSVSFNYNMDIVSKIKDLPERYYNPGNHEWEIPIKDINLLVNTFSSYKVNIIGKVNTKVNKSVKSVKHIEKGKLIYTPKTKPYQHQTEAFEYAKTHDKFLLSDEQGLGKSMSSINIAIAYKNLFKHCLVVCGVNGLKWNWLEEVKLHSNEKAHIIGSRINSKNKLVEGGSTERIKDLETERDEYFQIINIESMRNKTIVDILEEKCKSGNIGFIITDEVHKMCNPTCQQTKGFLKLNSQFKIAMSGTPMMNKPLDLFVTLKWLNVENHSFYAFKNHYCNFGGYGGYEIISYKNMSELQDKLNTVMLRRLKSEVLDLPEKIYSNEYVEMGNVQSRIYKDILNSIKSDIMTIKANPNPLAQLTRLRQATGWTGIVSSVETSSKMDRLLELVEEKIANKEKIIIFSNWTNMTDIIQEKLKQYNPAIITGKVKNRMEQINKFQTDDTCPIIIGTLGALGTGVTLTAASTVIFTDLPWNRALFDQASDRAHRIGQKSTVNIITLITKDTIDEKVLQLVEEKGMMADALIDGKVDKLNSSKMVDFLLS